jgi:hypothetical protein
MTRAEEFTKIFERTGTTKFLVGYGPFYAELPDPVRLLEIGLQRGHSLRAWQAMYPNASIWGIEQDTTYRDMFPAEVNVLWEDARMVNVDPLPDFDMIVDDASHIAEDIIAVWRRLRSKCRGYYIIEDLEEGTYRAVWDAVVADVPKAHISFHRTSDYSHNCYIMLVRLGPC